MEYSHELPEAESSEAEGLATRIDPAHEPVRTEEPVATSPRRRRRRQFAAVGAQECLTVEPPEPDTPAPAEAPLFVVEPPEAIEEIVVNHADDLARHLAERLQEVERREVEVARFHEELTLAEAAARAWVTQSDQEFTQRERQLKLREDDVSTREAAVAAAEIASHEEIRGRWSDLDRRAASLDEREAELKDCADRLAAERTALDEAVEKLHAQRRREEELLRSRHQQWQSLMEADRAQLERAMTNLHRHRAALERRERSLETRQREQFEQQKGELRPAVAEEHSPPATIKLDAALERSQAVRDHRAALEHRWIAGQLWSRLVGRALTTDEQLQQSLAQVRSQLDLLYRREREALSDMRSSVLAAARQLVS